jgi:protein-S-isoprenylcysteine O-methyltransferase Ste14
MLYYIAQAVLFVCWLLWALAFIRPRSQASGQKEAVRDSSSKWGIVLEAVGFLCVSAHVHPVGFQKSAPSLIASMILAPAAVCLVWGATRHLGKQWRFQAGLNQDHELIQTGPYSVIRHPIYTSMFGMLLAAGFAIAWWPLFVTGVIFFIIGTEIRVRAEEGLLAAHFQDTFPAYRARTSAYIPFLR